MVEVERLDESEESEESEEEKDELESEEESEPCYRTKVNTLGSPPKMQPMAGGTRTLREILPPIPYSPPRVGCDEID